MSSNAAPEVLFFWPNVLLLVLGIECRETGRKEENMLFTRCILGEPRKNDGLRISVMSRHTPPNGRTPDTRITPFDIHMPILGPSPELIGDYYKRGLPWEEFELRYVEEISRDPKDKLVRWLARTALERAVTLLCIEETCEHCHRRLLAHMCRVHYPDLVVLHR
jgi:uncharacterized protein YeaO (DUF488 family)